MPKEPRSPKSAQLRQDAANCHRDSRDRSRTDEERRGDRHAAASYKGMADNQEYGDAQTKRDKSP